MALLALLAGLAPPSLAATSGADYNAFLKSIATDCKPLTIGRFNFAPAILDGGRGVDMNTYHKFISYTSRLYRGTLTDAEYRRSLTAFLNAGSSNSQSFDCIAAHLPPRKDHGR